MLTSKQRAYLRKLANPLAVTLHIGKLFRRTLSGLLNLVDIALGALQGSFDTISGLLDLRNGGQIFRSWRPVGSNVALFKFGVMVSCCDINTGDNSGMACIKQKVIVVRIVWNTESNTMPFSISGKCVDSYLCVGTRFKYSY